MKKIKIRNKNGLSATFTNYGARLMLLYVPDNKGVMSDVVLGFNEPEDYLSAEEKYFGVIVGRYANRINQGIFEINHTTYHLAKNNPPNSLHGGIEGFHKKIWDIIEESEDKLVMSCISEDGEEGFPGTVKVEVTFHLTEDNALKIAYKATSNQPTPINLTHHSYFNLKGHDQGEVLNHELTIHANHYTFIDENLKLKHHKSL